MALSQACSNLLTPSEIARAMRQPIPNTQGFLAGFGNPKPRLILVGEAPGETELTSHRPFSGRAGAKLALMLDVLGLTRADVFITVSFPRRPVRLNEKTQRVVNRPPTPSEILADADLLDCELSRLPQVPLLLMGNTAINRLYQGRVSDYAGQIIHHTLKHKRDQQLMFTGAVRTFAVCAHPAALLYRKQTEQATLAQLSAIKAQLLEDFA